MSTVHNTIIENKMIFHSILFSISQSEISESKDVYLRFLPAQQLPQRHLEEGRRRHGGAGDRGGDQAEAEAAAEPVLSEHRPTQGEPAAC